MAIAKQDAIFWVQGSNLKLAWTDKISLIIICIAMHLIMELTQLPVVTTIIRGILYPYLCLYHLHSLIPHLADYSSYVYERLPHSLPECNAYGYEAPCPPHTTITVDQEWALGGLVVRFDTT